MLARRLRRKSASSARRRSPFPFSRLPTVEPFDPWKVSVLLGVMSTTRINSSLVHGYEFSRTDLAFVAVVRAGRFAGPADRRTRTAGPRRRRALAGHAVDHHLVAARGSRAQPRPGPVGRNRRPRRVIGRAARRRPHADARLA